MNMHNSTMDDATLKECIKKASFNPTQKELPLYLVTACSKCQKIVPSEVTRDNNDVILVQYCDVCGDISQKLADTFFSEVEKSSSTQPTKTITGAKIYQKSQGFPKTVHSLCPECKKTILGIEYIRGGNVYMDKTCPEHGYCTDLVYSNAQLFTKLEKWGFEDNKGLSNPKVNGSTACPYECGLCNAHTSHTGLGVVDLTNRCNLTCPICFANANAVGYIFEPDFDQVVTMMQALRDEKPTPAVAVQFSGGEPTLHPRFLDIVRKANEMGFSHVQIATNGIKLTDMEFVKQCEEAGLHQIYLQFDGFSDEVYESTRGEKLLAKKYQVVENIRQTNMKICLVPTIVKGINDHEVVPIVNFAIQNADVISAISFQPVAFTGRIDYEQRMAQRYTLGDIANALDEAGIAKADRDFYPLSSVVPFSKLLEALTGDKKIMLSAHTHCSTASYYLIDKENKAHPFTKFLDVEGLLTDINEQAPKLQKSPFKLLTKIHALNFMRKHFIKEEAPNGMSFLDFLQSLQGLTDKKLGRGEQGKKNWRTLLVAGMHFMDGYNYDVERVKRCLIHYPSPEGKIYPFCTYNAGPFYREQVEKKFSMTVEEWRERSKK